MPQAISIYPSLVGMFVAVGLFLAILFWQRRQRKLRGERPPLETRLDKGQGRRSRGQHSSLQWMEWERLGDPIWYMEGSVLGNRLIETWLGEVRAAVEKEGELTEVAIQKVVQGFGGKPNSLTRELEELRLRLQDNPEGLDDTSLRQKKKTQALAFLDRKLSRFQLRIDQCEEREASEDAARQAAAVLPSTDVLDKILRYEAKLERQLYRAMAQLERLQRMRKGEAVPAPLTMVV